MHLVGYLKKKVMFRLLRSSQTKTNGLHAAFNPLHNQIPEEFASRQSDYLTSRFFLLYACKQIENSCMDIHEIWRTLRKTFAPLQFSDRKTYEDDFTWRPSCLRFPAPRAGKIGPRTG